MTIDHDPIVSANPNGVPFPFECRDVVVGPLLRGSSKHAFVFEVGPYDVPLVHMRQRGRSVVDVSRRSLMEAAAADAADVEDGPVIYAGPYIAHFGHFTAECIHRLYPRSVFPDLRQAKIAFQTTRNGVLELTPWIIQILDLFNVSARDVITINRNVRFKSLLVPVQGRVMAGPSLIDGYSSILPLNKGLADVRSSATPHRYYVSRVNHMHSGSFLGESLVQRRLEEAGFKVLYPEDMSTVEIVRLLRAAELVVFSEGSAIHNLELCGRTDVRVFVIGRRAGSRDRFRYLLEDFTAAWHVFEDFVDGTPLDWDNGMNRPSIQRACAYVNLHKLMADLSRFIGAPLPNPTKNEIEDAVRADLAHFVLDPRTTRDSTSNERLGELLRLLRSQFAAVKSELSDR